MLPFLIIRRKFHRCSFRFKKTIFPYKNDSLYHPRSAQFVSHFLKTSSYLVSYFRTLQRTIFTANLGIQDDVKGETAPKFYLYWDNQDFIRLSELSEWVKYLKSNTEKHFL